MFCALSHPPHCLSDRLGRPRALGFTLIELLVVIAIVGILSAAAVPSFVSSLAAAALQDQASALSRSINLARSEAIKRGRTVSVCRSDNPEAAVPVCGANGNWATGWIVFEGTANAPVVVKIQPAFSSGTTITTNGVQGPLAFNALGLGIGMQQTFVFAPKSAGSTRNRELVLNATGRWTTSKAVAP